jgi:pilus assembly protein Flp/PilA
MLTSFTQLLSFCEDESGSTAIEYAMIASLISAAIVGALGIMRDDLSTTLTDVSTAMTTAAAAN